MSETFSPILLLFPGDHLATPGVVAEIATVLRGQGFETALNDVRTGPSLDGYGAVILGAPFQRGLWHEAARTFLVDHRAELMAKPVAIFGLSRDEHAAASRHELIHEMSHYRWLHPIAADVFHVRRATAEGRDTMGATVAVTDLDTVRTWAHLVAHLLTPAGTRSLTS